jgi:hypothetical protein
MFESWQRVSNYLWLILIIESLGILVMIAGIGALVYGIEGALPAAAVSVGSLIISIGAGLYSKVYDGEALLNEVRGEERAR